MGSGLRIKLICATLALSLWANAAFAFAPLNTAEACHSVVTNAVDGLNALPLTKKILAAKLSKGWHDRFDLEMYHDLTAKYRAKIEQGTFGLEEWGFAESQLAYLTAMIEKSLDRDITIGDLFIEDPNNARALQLLCRKIDFSRNLTSHELETVVEKAFMLTGKLDLKLTDLANMSTDRVRAIMQEHAWKEMTKVGIVDLYTRMGLRTYTSREIRSMRNEAVRAAFLDRKIPIEQLDAELAKIQEYRVEGFMRKWKRYFRDPRLQAALVIPTWNPASMASRLHLGVLPDIAWVTFEPAILERCMKLSLEECVKLIEPQLKTMMVVDRTYKFVQHVIAIWAGVFTFAYAIGQLNDLTPDEMQDWVVRQGKAAMLEYKTEFEREQHDGGHVVK
ncbi:MAG: hypothetical protein JST04_05185 [Bdellovibrionales bacterium]|nr:hypothetical protein [Bdellovibrionales bacterium]